MSSLSTLTEMMAVTLSAATVTAAAAVFARRFLRPMLMEQNDVRKKKQTRVKDLIQKKLTHNIELTSQDVLDIGRGAGVSQTLDY